MLTFLLSTYHLYPDSWGIDSSEAQEWGNDWVINHNTACAAVGKPCLLEEFGFSATCDIMSDWQSTALNADATSGDLYWQYGDTLSYGKTHDDGNTAYYGDDLFTCLVTNHVADIDDACTE